MVAGHVLLSILSGISVDASIFFGRITVKIIIIAILPLSISLIIYFAEFGIGIMQAYIFNVLSSIYIGESFIEQH